jgi:hypothetical protein
MRGKRSRRVGVRGIGVSGSRKLLQLEVTIRDFPIVMEVWAIGARAKDRCQRVNLAGVNAKWHRESKNRRSRERKFYTLKFREFQNSDRGKDRGLVD